MIGAGGLGSPLGLYLAAAGVGHIGLVDFDVVDASNLQRQILHGTSDVGRLKTASARDRLHEINPRVDIATYETHLTSENALRIVRDYDIVVDGTDNFPTRYLVNDACALLAKPNVYGSIFKFEGQASVFWAAKGACYRCLYPEPPPPGLVPSCAEGGVLGVLPGIVGSIQANETIKLILGAEGILLNRLLLFDAWKMKFRELKLRKNPNCPMCGLEPDDPGTHRLRGVLRPAPPGGRPGSGRPRPDHGSRTRRLDQAGRRRPDHRRPRAARVRNRQDSQHEADSPQPGGEPGHRNRSGPDHRRPLQSRGAQLRGHLGAPGSGLRRQLINLQGGILAWSNDVDPSVPKY